jgi:hypothetical protein
MVVFSQNFTAHFVPSFLIQGKTSTLRHGDNTWGVLLPTTLIFMLLGVVAIGVRFTKHHSKVGSAYQKLLIFGVIWMIIGIIPAALGADDVPHSNRALLALPGFLLTAAAGFILFIDRLEQSKLNHIIRGNHNENNTLRDAVIGSCILLHGVFFLSFWRHYLTAFASQSAAAFQDGYLEAMELVKQYEKGTDGKPQVDKIMFSSEYGQPYIYALFSRKTDPVYYRGGSLIKYEFTDVSIGDFQRSNTLIVATQGDTDLPQAKADHIVYGSDGSVRFHLYYRP